PVAKAAEIHLAPRPGTNLALVNGLLQQLIVNDWIDHDFVGQRTKGFDALASVLANYEPSRVAEICGIATWRRRPRSSARPRRPCRQSSRVSTNRTRQPRPRLP